MGKSQGDNSQASVPEPRKVQLLGRNVNIKKLKLKQRLQVSRILFSCIRALKGEDVIDLGGGVRVPRKRDLENLDVGNLLDAAPAFLAQVESNYPEFMSMTTDMTAEEIEELDIPDLFTVAGEVWDYNGFDKMVEEAAKQGKAAGVLGIPNGSSEQSPSLPSPAVGVKTKS